jgi:hypothetical protein
MLLSLLGVRLDGTRERREDAGEPAGDAAGPADAAPAATPEEGRRDG